MSISFNLAVHLCECIRRKKYALDIYANRIIVYILEMCLEISYPSNWLRRMCCTFVQFIYYGIERPHSIDANGFSYKLLTNAYSVELMVTTVALQTWIPLGTWTTTTMMQDASTGIVNTFESWLI